jgi:hypothetical protein
LDYKKVLSKLFINWLLKMKLFALIATGVLSHHLSGHGYMNSGVEPSYYSCPPGHP